MPSENTEQRKLAAIMPVAAGRRPALTRLAAMLVIALVLIGAALPTFLRTWSRQRDLDDFAVVYSGAQAMASRADISTHTAGMYIYSPFLAFIFQSLTALPEHAAAIVWLTLSAGIILAASLIAARKVTQTWQLSARETDSSIPWLVSATALLLSFEKIRSDFTLGQTDCLIMAGLVCVLCWMHRRPWLTAVAVGATANIKYLALIFVPYFVIKKNYRAAIASALSFFFFFTLPAIEVGLPLIKNYAINAVAVLTKVVAERDFLSLTPPGGGHKPVVNAITWDHSVSFTSSILRMTRSLGVSDLIATILILSLFAAVVTLIVLIGRNKSVDLLQPDNAITASRRDQIGTIEWATLIVLALVFGPQTTARHMILLLLVYTVGMGILLAQKQSSRRIVLIVTMTTTALALSLPFRDTGAHPLLVTLKSIGAASLCAVFLLISIAWIGSDTISENG